MKRNGDMEAAWTHTIGAATFPKKQFGLQSDFGLADGFVSKFEICLTHPSQSPIP